MGTSLALGDLTRGGNVFQMASGGKIAVFVQGSSGNLVVYKNLTTTPSVAASQTSAQIFGSTATYRACSACVDSTGVIHVVCMASSAVTRELAYNTLSSVEGTPSWGTWEAADATTNGFTNISPAAHLAVDQNDVPHLIWIDIIKTHGTEYEQIVYTNRIGGSWSTTVVVNGNNQNNYRCGPHAMLVRDNNSAEALYHNNNNSDIYYNSRSGGSWGTESVYTGTYDNQWQFGGVAQNNTAGTIRRVFANADAARSIMLNNVDSTYDIGSGNTSDLGIRPYVRNSNNVLYVLYQPTTTTLGMLSHNNTAWTNEGTVETGLTNPVAYETSWSYLVQNNTSSVDYIYMDNGTVFYGQFSFAAVATRRIMGGFTINQNPMQL